MTILFSFNVRDNNESATPLLFFIPPMSPDSLPYSPDKHLTQSNYRKTGIYLQDMGKEYEINDIIAATRYLMVDYTIAEE